MKRLDPFNCDRRLAGSYRDNQFHTRKAMITAPDRKLYVGSSVTPVHCQKKYHCHWRGEGANRSKHCHICG